MAGWARTGVLTQPASTGVQSITGLPGQPVFVFFWSHGNESDAAWEADGAWGDTPSEGVRRSFGWISSEGVLTQAALSDALGFTGTTTDTRQTLNTSACCLFVNPANTTTDGAAKQSLDANGFSINWAVVSGRQYRWHWMALGGANLRAYPAALTTASTGDTTPITLTIPSGGAGTFQPKGLIMMSMAHTASNSSSYGLGAADAHGNQWMGAATLNDAQAGVGNQRRGQSTAGLYSILSTGSGNLEGYLSLSSWNSDGVTFSVGNDFSGTRSGIAILLGGTDLLDFRVGTSAKPTGAAPATQAITGMGFQPEGLFAVSLGMPTQGVTGSDDVSNALWSIGAADDAANQNVSAMRFAEAAANRHGAYADDAALVVHGDEAGATNSTRALATLTGMDADGFTLSWATNDAAADLVHYAAFDFTAAAGGIANRINPARLSGRLGGLVT